MKKILLLTIVSLLFQFAQAQRPGGGGQQPKKGIGKITGVVLDEASGKAVEFSTVSLYIQETEELISGSISDENGKFVIDELKDNIYKLEISFLGYENLVVEDVEMKREKNVSLGKIRLSAAAATLDEVIVKSERSLIEEKVDRMVYNAEQDDLAKGGDAADVLRKVPLLQVDLEGNVTLRGTSNIRVLINNKPSTIMADNVADALKMMPADMIKKVEVITSPSAKYDAEGSGGIINIITKKNNLEGYYLNVNTGVGLRGSSLGLNGSFRKGKFGMTLGGRGRAFYARSENSSEQFTLEDGIENLSSQFAEARNNGIFGRYNLGLDYDIDNTQFLSGGVRYGIRSFSNDQLQTTELSRDNVLNNTFLRNIDGTRSSNSIDANLDYLKIFKENQEWSISSLYSIRDGNSNFISDNLTDEEVILNSLKNDNDSRNQEMTFQTDFQTPIGDNQMFEVGGKGIFRRVDSDFSYLFAEAGGDFVLDPRRPAGTLDYEQNVSAAYTSYTYSTPSKLTFKVGARYEKTAINATQDGENIDIPDYDNLVPSVNISKRLANYSTIKLGYSRRIQRPGLRQLNPNVNVSNSQDIQAGNPSLEPELSDNIELGYSGMVNKTYFNISLFTRFTDNAINQVRYPLGDESGAIFTTYDNIGREQATGLNIFAKVNITDNWSINGGLNTNYAQLEGQIVGLDGQTETAENSGINYGGRLMTEMKLNGGWSMQAFTFMRGRRVQLQGWRGGYGMYALGFNKDLKNEKGSFGISAENFAGRGWNMRSETTSPFFTQTTDRLFLNRSIRVNFSYKLGKMNFQETRKKTRSVRNDDVMGGGDEGGGQSGGGNVSGGGGSSSRGGGSKSRSSSKKSSKKAKAGDSEKTAPVGQALDFSGKWQGTAQTPRGEMTQTFNFQVEGENVTGTIETPRGEREISNGKILPDGQFEFEVDFGRFVMKQTGTIISESEILLQNERGEMTIRRVE